MNRTSPDCFCFFSFLLLPLLPAPLFLSYHFWTTANVRKP
jgi:hypothetical protein